MCRPSSFVFSKKLHENIPVSGKLCMSGFSPRKCCPSSYVSFLLQKQCMLVRPPLMQCFFSAKIPMTDLATVCRNLLNIAIPRSIHFAIDKASLLSQRTLSRTVPRPKWGRIRWSPDQSSSRSNANVLGSIDNGIFHLRHYRSSIERLRWLRVAQPRTKILNKDIAVVVPGGVDETWDWAGLNGGWVGTAFEGGKSLFELCCTGWIE